MEPGAPDATPLLTVVMPVYNEIRTLEEILRRVLASLNKGFASAAGPAQGACEVLLVDDGSTDGTREVFGRLPQAFPGAPIRVLLHEKNQGKGAAVRTGLAQARGRFILIQDADLEYDPAEYPRLLQPLLDGHADVVYGSRFLGGPHRVFHFWHWVANRVLTFVTNLLYDLNLSDMETCYKVFRREAVGGMPLRSCRFGIEPELTAKFAKRRLRLYEVPIAYYGRGYEEGKKIGWKDGVSALWCLIRFRFGD